MSPEQRQLQSFSIILLAFFLLRTQNVSRQIINAERYFGGVLDSLTSYLSQLPNAYVATYIQYWVFFDELIELCKDYYLTASILAHDSLGNINIVVDNCKYNHCHLNSFSAVETFLVNFLIALSF